jgi:phosphatidate cytidylyltransferase
MKTRLLTALVALPLLFAAIILPIYIPETIWIFVGLAIIALGAGLFEFFSLTKNMELKADAGMAYIGAAVFVFVFAVDAPTRAPEFLILIAALFVVAVLISETFRFQADFTKMLAGVGVTLLGVFYLAFLGGFLIAMRVGFENAPGLSTKLLLFFFIVIFASDTGAYFVGKAIGKNKLVPKISPGKTWEGLFGGIAGAVGAAAICSATFFPELAYKASLPLAAVMAGVGVLGDLAESAIKRGAGAKDAATILPGHGGLLDRLDSLLFNAPILYYFAKSYFSI